MSQSLLAPFAKVEETKDGGREVWGFATLERVDKSGEIADFDSTVKSFEKWSNEISERTGGKNLGNVRVMHEKIAAGKTIHWEPAEKTIKKDDGSEEIIKGIYVGAYIPPTKPEVIKDVDEGILSAFSIGGSYAKRWYDNTSKAFRYTPTIAEYSLVDNPCVEGADIDQVIAKSDGPWNKDNRNLEKEEKTLENENQELNKRAKLTGSYEELQQNIQNAVAQKLKGFSNYWDGYVVATMPDKVVVFDYNSRKYLEIPYTNTDGVIAIGDKMVEVKEVTDYIPVETQKIIEGELQKRSKKVTDSNKTPPKGYPTDKNQYADPDNYKYPIDKDHIKAAASYFNHDGEKEKGGYTDEQWDSIGKKIAAAASKLEGGEYKYESGKVATPDKESEKEDKKGDMAQKSINEEDLKKAAETAGLDFGKLKVFFNALELGKSAASEDEEDDKEVGDKKDDKETKEEDKKEEKKESKKDDAEKAVIDELEKAVSILEGEPLAKVGASISEKNKTHLAHAINHIKAAIEGKDYTDNLDDNLDNESGQGNTGEEAPAFKFDYGKISKSFNNELEKSYNKLESLFKGVATADALTKAVESLTKTAADLDEVKKLVKEIHETPQDSNVVLNGGSSEFSKSFNIKEATNMETQVIENLIKTTNDAVLRDKLGQALAIKQLELGLK